VYADWLIEAGNPRGEVAALQLAGDEAAANAMIAAHAEQLVGKELAGYESSITWCGGFWDALVIDDPFRSVPRHPSARLLRKLVLQVWDPGAYADWIAAARMPALRSLCMGGVHWEGNDIIDEAEWSCPQLHRVLAKFPRLEELTITCGRFSFGDSASLRSFTCDGYSLRRSSLQAIFAAKLPALERLDLRDDPMNVEEDELIEVEHFAPLFEGKLFPSLREIVLDKSLAKAAKASPLARRATITVR
jgi:hypothetical protein